MGGLPSKIAEREAKTGKLQAETQKILAEGEQPAETPAQPDAAQHLERIQQMAAELQRLYQELANRDADNQTKLQQTVIHETAETERALIRAGQQRPGLRDALPA